MAMRKVAILAGAGGRDTAYKVLNLAAAAASMGAEVAVFCTFEGLKLVHRDRYGDLELPPALQGLAPAFAARGIPTVPELMGTAVAMGVRFVACQMSMDLMGMTAGELVDGVTAGGAAAFLAAAAEADVTLTF